MAIAQPVRDDIIQRNRRHQPDLCFGTENYDDAEKAMRSTRWLFEKNMQGIPFLEALVRRVTTGADGFRVDDALHQVCDPETTIAPRVEVWIDPANLGTATAGTVVGSLLLGTWTSSLKDRFRSDTVWKSRVNPRPRWSRNFHQENLTIEDLRYERVADRIRRMLESIGSVVPLDARMT